MSSHFAQRPRTQPMPAICKKGWPKPTIPQQPLRLQVFATIHPDPARPDASPQAWTVQLLRDPALPTFEFLGAATTDGYRLEIAYDWFPGLRHFVFRALLTHPSLGPERWTFAHHGPTLLDAPHETADIESELSFHTPARFSIMF